MTDDDTKVSAKDLIKWIKDGLTDKKSDINIYDLQNIFETKSDRIEMEKIFTPTQCVLLHAIIKLSLRNADWHNEDEESHENLRTKQSKMDARLRNHRHEMDKKYSAKAEF